jgi:hypothetical protein
MVSATIRLNLSLAARAHMSQILGGSRPIHGVFLRRAKAFVTLPLLVRTAISHSIFKITKNRFHDDRPELEHQTRMGQTARHDNQPAGRLATNQAA